MSFWPNSKPRKTRRNWAAAARSRRPRKPRASSSAGNGSTPLWDPGTFREINMLAETQTFEFDMQKKKILGDGVVTGMARINGRNVFVYSQDRNGLRWVGRVGLMEKKLT